MNNIEDDVKEIKKFTNASILYGNKIGITTSQHNKLREAMQNILLEREQDKARIKELEEENASKQKVYDDCYCEYKHYKQFDSIPKQKVKDMFKKSQTLYEKKLKEIDFKELKNISLNIFEGIKIEAERSLLRRLLQKSEDK